MENPRRVLLKELKAGTYYRHDNPDDERVVLVLEDGALLVRVIGALVNGIPTADGLEREVLVYDEDQR